MKELLFFDLECRQENGNHEPNLCIVQDEAGEEWIFQDDKTIDEFCEWLFTMEHAGCTVMAHNFQGYDSYFILQVQCDHAGCKSHEFKGGVIRHPVHRLAQFPSHETRQFTENVRYRRTCQRSLSSFLQQERKRELCWSHSTCHNPDGMNPKDREAFMAYDVTKIESS